MVFDKYIQLCGEIGNFTEVKTGINVIDAYFGPENLAPEKQRKDVAGEELRSAADVLRDEIKDAPFESALRKEYLLGELSSLRLVVEWLDEQDVDYSSLVEGLFHIKMERFPDDALDRVTERVEDALSFLGSGDLHEKATKFIKQGEVTGEELRILIEGELQEKASDVSHLFKERVFARVGTDSLPPDNGVEYRCVRDEPWGGYNYYQGGFKSINEFNIDRPFNREYLRGVIYHEYEHHVSNLWREKAYRDEGFLELSIVPLHTGRCIISEGTADTAKEFLGVVEDNPRAKAFQALYELRRMVSINSAILMNAEGGTVKEAIDYSSERGLRNRDSARGSTDFTRPVTKSGKPNLWAPYVFTYYIGRFRYVLPTYEKVVEQDQIDRFFNTVYANPFSCSSLTWEKAFSWL